MKSFQWVLEVPYDIPEESMNDVLKAYNFNTAKDASLEIKSSYKKDI
jgi:hypothetical protein